MEFLTSPFKAYVRWRHSRGFGVHSPFAYNLVRMAIHPGDYGYYGYSDIDRVLLSPGYKAYPHARDDARLLLRLLVQLRSRRLILPEGLPAMEAAAKAAGAASRRFRKADGDRDSLPAPREGDFLVSVRDILTPDQLSLRLQRGTSLLILYPSKETAATIHASCGRGLIFHGLRLLLAIPREEMAFVSYTMRF